MNTHTIRPTQIQFGFVIDDEMIVHQNNDRHTLVIHLNKGPKKLEDFKNYTLCYHDTCTYHNKPERIMCNEHVCIDIVPGNNNTIYYMCGYISNFRESDLENFNEETKRVFTNLSSNNLNYYIKRNTRTQNVDTYLRSIFGPCSKSMFYDSIREIEGILIFREQIYVDGMRSKFAVNLNNVKLKDEFNELIKVNVDKIKKILFPTNIPSEGNYSVY